LDTDVDEFIAPLPTKYPEGLSQYLAHFNNNSINHVRMCAYVVGHVCETNDGSKALEQEIDWNKPMLQQRNYAYRIGKYINHSCQRYLC
jgi:hypothetical protein